MKKALLFLLILSFPAYAAPIDKVAVWEHADGQISVTHFDSQDKMHGESDEEFIVRHTERLKKDPLFGSSTLAIIPSSNIPADRKNRSEWSLRGNKVEVDQQKVAAKEAAKAARESKIKQLFKMTPQEFEEAKAMGIFK